MRGVVALRALKAFRVFRMFTMFKDWPSMRLLMRQVHRSLEDLFYFGMLLCLFVFVFAQIGVAIAKDKLILSSSGVLILISFIFQ